jgi:hypothetical protein
MSRASRSAQSTGWKFQSGAFIECRMGRFGWGVRASLPPVGITMVSHGLLVGRGQIGRSGG